MGALHEGHLSLLGLARSDTDVVVMSIFVNPLQFGPREDLAAYPRDEERDVTLAGAAGVDVVFVPDLSEMYPAEATTIVSVGGVAGLLEGAHRPGHFDGVATVVAKLFNIVEPDRAYFGQKDAQQVAVIRKLVEDLDFDVEVEVGPTVREPDGLALSSRNAYLTPEERPRAVALYRALRAGESVLLAGGSIASAEERMQTELDSDGLEVDYATAVDPATFGEASGATILLVVAARLGSTRLIDNLLVSDLEHGTGDAGL
jgi:pantoate--beta-alanine ligase